VIPELQKPVADPDWSVRDDNFLSSRYSKLCKARAQLIELYADEFLQVLLTQATSLRDGYKPVRHEKLRIGDIVLLTYKNLKQYGYPLGIVREIEENGLGEVTAAKVYKGITKEIVYRHATSLILFIPADKMTSEVHASNSIEPTKVYRRRRVAAKKATSLIKNQSSLY